MEGQLVSAVTVITGWAVLQHEDRGKPVIGKNSCLIIRQKYDIYI